jgi:hypothetical protein
MASVARRRWIPAILVSTVIVLTGGAAALGTSQQPSGSSLEVATLKSEMLTPGQIDPGWQQEPYGSVAGVTRDTWNPTQCWKWGTTFGGPVVSRHFEGAPYGVPFLDETIMDPSAGSKAVYEMMRRCPGPLPPRLHQGVLHRLPTNRTTIFNGIGDPSSGSVAMDGGRRSVAALFVQGSKLVFFDYLGSASLGQIRQWAQNAASKVG